MSTPAAESPSGGQAGEGKPTALDPRVVAGLQRVALDIRKRYEAGTGIGAAIAPTEEWIQRTSPALMAGEVPEVPDEDLVVSFALIGSLSFVSMLVPREQWPGGATAVCPLFKMPLKEFKARIEGQMALGAAAARTVGGR